MTKKIPLYNKHMEIVSYSLVDDDDYPALNSKIWRVVDGYAARSRKVNKKQVIEWMHRAIVSCPSNKVVDHINHDRKDNRKDNLRICTNQQNSQNKSKVRNATTSIYKGVNCVKGKWSAQVKTGGTIYYLGRFSTELEAAKAYNIKARELFGEFANTNDIPEDKIHINYRRYTSIYRGVSFNQGNRWAASIGHNGKKISLGLFMTEIEAAIAYNRAAVDLLKEKAIINSIPVELQGVEPKRLKRMGRGKSGFIGVYCEKGGKKYFSRIIIGKKNVRIGNYLTATEAAHAYDKVCWDEFHDLERLNFPDEVQV